ncbi:MAG: hypothetical protein C0393_07000, partial [Anaerolinea sp.]|nr:hypothetical protein [Anaerolinea sp.]
MKRKTIPWFILGLIGCLGIAVGAFFWATNLMADAQAYRSPLADTPPAPGEPFDYAPPSGTSQGAPLTRRVVIVLIDALRYDTALKPEVMPFLNDLRTQAATATMHSHPPSFSAPGWNTILTGAWPEINDSQLFNPPDFDHVRALTQDDVFAAAERAGLRAAVSGYAWFEGMLLNSGVDAGFYTRGEDAAADRLVVDAALPWLTEDYQLILIHIDQVDYAGHHEGGPRDPRWDAAARRADALLGEIVSHLDLEQDTVIVLSDHGQIERGGHGGPDPVTLVEPFVLVGAGVVPGNYGDVNMVDVAPTVAILLGTSIPASSQGHALTDMLTLSPEQEPAIQEALKAQQGQLFAAYTTVIHSTARIESGEVVSATQAAMEQARAGRLGRERVWRNVLAFFLAFTPAYLFYLRKDRKVLWLAAGALFYLAIFNFRYAILDGRTYSLASVEGETWLIVYTATTAAIGVILGWLIPMFGLRAFRRSPRAAAGISLGYVWFTLYLLALPVLLSFALNGITATWTLPEFYTLYIGLLSIIQSLIVAAVGLLLTG